MILTLPTVSCVHTFAGSGRGGARLIIAIRPIFTEPDFYRARFHLIPPGMNISRVGHRT